MPEKATQEQTEQVESDLNALSEADYDTSDAGTGNKTMTEADVAKLTGTSSSKAAEAAHQQRDDDGRGR